MGFGAWAGKQVGRLRASKYTLPVGGAIAGAAGIGGYLALAQNQRVAERRLAAYRANPEAYKHLIGVGLVAEDLRRRGHDVQVRDDLDMLMRSLGLNTLFESAGRDGSMS